LPRLIDRAPRVVDRHPGLVVRSPRVVVRQPRLVRPVIRSYRPIIRHHPYHRTIVRPCYRGWTFWPFARHHFYFGGTIRILGCTIPRVYVHRVVVSDEPRVIVYDAPDVVVHDRVYLSRQERLIEELLRGDTDQREDAARELAEYDNVSAVAALIDALVNDVSPDVREAAARSLGKIESPFAYEALVRVAAIEDDEDVAEAAREAAEVIADEHDDDELTVSERWPEMTDPDADDLAKYGEYLEILRFGNANEREKAAGKLHDFPGTQTVAALIDAMINDANEEVREEAAESLGKVGDRLAMPFLNWTREHDPDKSTRKDAEEAIKKIRNTIP
jgi:hypothetical protein